MDISIIVASCKFEVACNFLFIWLRFSSVFCVLFLMLAVRCAHKISKAVVFKYGSAEHR